MSLLEKAFNGPFHKCENCEKSNKRDNLPKNCQKDRRKIFYQREIAHGVYGHI